MAKKKTQLSPAAGLFESPAKDKDAFVSTEVDTKQQPFTEKFNTTQGRKGKKKRRMSLPVTDEEYEAIVRGSRAENMTYGEFVYKVIGFYENNKEG